MWKRDNRIFSLFYGIGKERKEGDVMGRCMHWLLYIWKFLVWVYVYPSEGILWSYGSLDGYTLESIFFVCMDGS
jgi:hypothetical protein